jgi:glycosyltransferase involved in cell wall biosynthesis
MPLRTNSTFGPDHRLEVDSTFASARGLHGKRVAMVTFSPYPADPRPRRAIDALLGEGMSIDLICLADEENTGREKLGELQIWRVPITHRRAGKLSYAYQYSAFILISASILASRCVKHRYDLAYVHNMPDILVASVLVSKAMGAKVILDLHDPMPELMTTIFNLNSQSSSVRLMRRLEKWSIRRANLVITVNRACKRIFAGRSCPTEKIGIVMNTPDGEIFRLQPPRPCLSPQKRCTSRFVIMYHGSIVERNGLDLAVQALARVRQAIPGAELRIFGRKTAFLDQIMNDARSMGLQSSVHYLGPRRLEDLVHEIEACDIGIIPNKRNAFTDINTPTRIFEYLALGKPVIAPRTAGIEDYFRSDSLFFFESGNPEDLAAKIQGVFFHPEHAGETAKRGQQVYLEHTWSQERNTLLKLVSELLRT